MSNTRPHFETVFSTLPPQLQTLPAVTTAKRNADWDKVTVRCLSALTAVGSGTFPRAKIKTIAENDRRKTAHHAAQAKLTAVHNTLEDTDNIIARARHSVGKLRMYHPQYYDFMDDYRDHLTTVFDALPHAVQDNCTTAMLRMASSLRFFDHFPTVKALGKLTSEVDTAYDAFVAAHDAIIKSFHSVVDSAMDHIEACRAEWREERALARAMLALEVEAAGESLLRPARMLTGQKLPTSPGPRGRVDGRGCRPPSRLG